MIQLVNNYGFKWKNRDGIWFKGYIFDENQIKSEDTIFSELGKIQTKEDLKIWLADANGCFSLVISKENVTYFAVDHIRTFPIFYTIDNGNLVVTDDPVMVFKSTKKINALAALELEATAYVTGNRTLFDGVYQVQAGELIEYRDNKKDCSFYSDFIVETINNSKFDILQQSLEIELNETFERLVNSLNGRQAVVPLSGGYDSRLIVTMLKKFEYNNVITFTYGRKGNFELANSRKSAEKLGYPWIFIEYDEDIIDGFIDEQIFKEYVHFAGKGSSMFFMQDYFAVKYLHENKLIEKDSVFIPGHSGDLLAGSHLRKTMKEGIGNKNLGKQIYQKTYFQNNHKNNKKQFLNLINNFIEKVPENTFVYNVFENWAYKERQAKFIVNSANVFDYFGYEYRLPFWDIKLIEFFKSVPFKYKINKILYDKTVIESFFAPYSVAFEKEIQPSAREVNIQAVKEKIRPYLPIKIKNQLLEKNDWMAYSIITKYFLDDLKNKNIPYNFQADIYNSIISKWYVEYVKAKLA